MTYGILWLRRNDKSFLKITIIGIVLLIIIHVYLSMSLFDVHSEILEFLNIITILILIIMFISILLKGIVPVAISCLGIVLIHGSIVIQSVFSNSLGSSIGYLNFEAMSRGTHGFFLLGVAMFILGMIVAYKPHILYTRNRPISTDQLWAKYPKWNEKIQLANTKTESLIGIPSLLSDTEKYLLWRYDFILVSIYGTVYQVPIYSYVPENSVIMRESISHKIIGASKYGYFI